MAKDKDSDKIRTDLLNQVIRVTSKPAEPTFRRVGIEDIDDD